jgi:hypothetical protein
MTRKQDKGQDEKHDRTMVVSLCIRRCRLSFFSAKYLSASLVYTIISISTSDNHVSSLFFFSLLSLRGGMQY